MKQVITKQLGEFSFVFYRFLGKKKLVFFFFLSIQTEIWGAQWLSGRVLDSRPRGSGFEPHRRHCVVLWARHIYPCLVLVQPRKTRPCLTERLLMGGKESNQTKQTNKQKSKYRPLVKSAYQKINDLIS